MADKTVSVEFRFPGLDKAAQDMERLGRAAKQAGDSSEVARQSVNGIGRPQALPNATIGGGAILPEHRAEWARRFPGVPFPGGDGGAVGAEPTAAQAERLRLEAQRNAVRTGSLFADDAARFQQREATEQQRLSQASYRNRLATERAMEAERKAFERNDPTAVAKARLDRQQLNDEAKRQMRMMQGLSPEEEGPGGLAGMRQGLAGTGLSRLLMPLFLAHAAGQVFEGAGRGFEDVARGQPTTYADALATVTRRMAEGIPIIGGFVQGIESMVDVFRGKTSRTAAAVEFGGASSRQLDLLGFAGITRTTATDQIFDLSRHGGDLAASSAGAQAFAASLTPEMLASFRPTGPLGDVQSGVGQAEYRRRTTAAAAAEATELARRRRADVDAAGAGIGQLEARGGDLRTALNRRLYTTSDALAETRSDSASLAQQLAQNELALAKQREDVQKRINDLTKAEGDASRARLDAKRAEIDVDRARLAVQEQDINRVRGGTIQAGLRSPLENQADLELARFLRANPDGGSPEQLARLRGNPIFAPFIDQLGLDRGNRDPAVQEAVRQFGGLGGQNLPEAEAERNRIMDDLTKRLAAASADAARDISKVFGDQFDKLIDVIVKAAEDKISAKAAEMDAKRLRELIQK
jgi:hypothetical protein